MAMKHSDEISMVQQTRFELEAMEIFRQLSSRIQAEIIDLLKARASDESGEAVLPKTAV